MCTASGGRPRARFVHHRGTLACSDNAQESLASHTARSRHVGPMACTAHAACEAPQKHQALSRATAPITAAAHVRAHAPLHAQAASPMLRCIPLQGHRTACVVPGAHRRSYAAQPPPRPRARHAVPCHSCACHRGSLTTAPDQTPRRPAPAFDRSAAPKATTPAGRATAPPGAGSRPAPAGCSCGRRGPWAGSRGPWGPCQ